MDGVAGVTPIELSTGALPVPDSPTEIGLPKALNGIESVPVSVPCPSGLNSTPIVQVDPAATVVQVLLLTAKSPVTVGADTVSDVLRWFVRVTVFAALVVPDAWLEKLKLVGETVAGAVPLPLRLTDCGLLAALSVNVRVPLAVPIVVGSNVTPTEQLAPAAMLVPQVLLAMA